MNEIYSIGLDFGTSSVRALVLNALSGEIICTASVEYPSGVGGVIYSDKNPYVARQEPMDYHSSMQRVINYVLGNTEEKGIAREKVTGIGIAATASTPLPVDSNLAPLSFNELYKNNINAKAWLWKDHSSHKEADRITRIANEIKPEYVKQSGGYYSSEWFFSKILHCKNIDKRVFDAAYTWLELSDYIPSVLCGITDNSLVKRNICAAGHKKMFAEKWGGLPAAEFLNAVDPQLALLRKKLFSRAYDITHVSGYLCPEWAEKTGLQEGIPVAVGSIDAHVGAIGAGIEHGTLVKIIGTSTCDILLHPISEDDFEIPGVAGIAAHSVIPGYWGIEAGQSAVGDIFDWYVTKVLNKNKNYHMVLTEKARNLTVGESGLISLDWNNGNRCILQNPNLTGLILGQTLRTEDYEIYRALIEATAFGAKVIIDRLRDYSVKIAKVINCGGISKKNDLLMQIYADVMGLPMHIAPNEETVSLGAAIIGAYTAGKMKSFHSIEDVQSIVCKEPIFVYSPIRDNHLKYSGLYKIYKKLYNGFGEKSGNCMAHLMSNLLQAKANAL